MQTKLFQVMWKVRLFFLLLFLEGETVINSNLNLNFLSL